MTPKTHGILFSPAMVRALLRRQKHMTRRVSNEPGAPPGQAHPSVPPYAVGDILWVREAWRTTVLLDAYADEGIRDSAFWPRVPLTWPADGEKRDWDLQQTGRPRLARFMPRWASRINLRVTAVRAERVRAIAARDCEAEGLVHGARDMWSCPGTEEIFREGHLAFRWLWDSLHGPGQRWDDDPWVWAISFDLVRSDQRNAEEPK